MASKFDFDTVFEALTGNSPFPWQRRLFDEWLVVGKLPAAVDIPTGLGKTNVMGLWLLARAAGAKLPRRLVYVVDRRAVVDQATNIAETIRDRLEKCKSLEPVKKGLGLHNNSALPISTLRGRYADNKEWRKDPAASAIIVGTVDMIGSRLLFCGYGVSKNQRPYHAGLLGVDALVMLDEAHLVPPFEELLKTIVRETNGNGAGLLGPSRANEGRGIVPPFMLLPLSATRRSNQVNEESDVFRLSPEDTQNEIVRERLEAAKTLTIENLTKDTKLEKALADTAWKWASEEPSGTETSRRILIYCNSRKVAEAVADDLQKRTNKDQSGLATILFVGGRRVYERHEAELELKRYGFIPGNDTALESADDRQAHDAKRSDNTFDRDVGADKPVFLIATSAGEVGVDLDADHMVCDLVAWERMVQRLGRVNRRGKGMARVLVIDQGPPAKSEDAAIASHKAVRHLLEKLPPALAGGHQSGPAALAKIGGEVELHDDIKRASTPMPLYPELSRPLVDAWAMTSLPDQHAGVPEVGPWLRGWVDDEEPQTSVVWRCYLPGWLENDDAHWSDSIYRQRRKELNGFFDSAPPQALEILETDHWRVAEWLRKRASKLQKSLKSATEASNSVSNTREENEGVADKSRTHASISPLRSSTPVAFPVQPDGSSDPPLRLMEIGTIKKEVLEKRIGGRRLIVDARLGGVKDGLLDEKSDTTVLTIEDNWGVQNISEEDGPDIRISVISTEARNKRLDESKIQEVFAMHYPKSQDETPEAWLVVEKRRSVPSKQETLAMASRLQKLNDHQMAVAQEVECIADTIGLSEDDRKMLVAAARHHDDGKRTPRWQGAFNAPSEDGPYAKTPGPLNQQALSGYRHEFQSVLDMQQKNSLDINSSSPQFDLMLHLIAAHHGYARPNISTAGCDALPPSVANRRAYEIAFRFARLQKMWGPWGLAWWEVLLRAADQSVSSKWDSRNTK